MQNMSLGININYGIGNEVLFSRNCGAIGEKKTSDHVRKGTDTPRSREQNKHETNATGV